MMACNIVGKGMPGPATAGVLPGPATAGLLPGSATAGMQAQTV